MDMETFHRHVRELATIEETASPFVSCYLNLEAGLAKCRHHLLERSRIVERSLAGQARQDLKDSLLRINQYLDEEIQGESRGAALFVRSGEGEYFLPMQFRVVVQNRFAVDTTANIYNLVQLEDECRHYVVVLVTEDSVRILEIHLGAVTATTWAEVPEGRRRVGREWTREHYRASQQDRAERFIKEQIQLIDRLMSVRGYAHLILAGSPKVTARYEKALPKHLAEKLVDSVAVSGGHKLDSIVDATLAAFIEREKSESLATVDKLKRGLYTDGLGVVGVDASLAALRNGQVDTLVIAKEFDDRAMREEMVKLATVSGSVIETVGDSYTLLHHGGVGCVLRYLLPEQYGS